jgi:hypothetical protein
MSANRNGENRMDGGNAAHLSNLKIIDGCVVFDVCSGKFHRVSETAANLTQSMQFIGLRPAVVLIGLDGSVNVIRRREKLIDVESAERTPGYLELEATQ